MTITIFPIQSLSHRYSITVDNIKLIKVENNKLLCYRDLNGTIVERYNIDAIDYYTIED